VQVLTGAPHTFEGYFVAPKEKHFDFAADADLGIGIETDSVVEADRNRIVSNVRAADL
jgi:hypothetical protein